MEPYQQIFEVLHLVARFTERYILKSDEIMLKIVLCLCILSVRVVITLTSVPKPLISFSTDDTYNVPGYEIMALYDLYNATNGVDWYWGGQPGVRWIFNSSANPCQQLWQGVICGDIISSDGYLHVKKLILIDYSLNGYIPETIGNLTHLNHLDLADNVLSEQPIPLTIGNLYNLTYIDLSNCIIKGIIPVSFGKLTNLTSLSLGNNHLSGSIPSELCELSSLIDLELYINDLTSTIPECIGQLSNLQTLQLSENALEGTLPASLANLTSIIYLLLYDNYIYGTLPETWYTLIHISMLDISHNLLTGTIPSYIGLYSNVTFIGLYSNYLHGTIPETIGNLTNLGFLYLAKNSIEGTLPQSMINMIKLQDLSLQVNELTGTIPSGFSQLSHLFYLTIHSNQFSGTIPNSLSNLTLLRTLYLENNHLTGTIPSIFYNMSEFRGIALNLNMLTGTIPPYLLDSLELSLVELSTNYLVGSFPSPVSFDWSHIVAISCASNYLTGPFPEGFGNESKLSYLNLSNNAFSGAISEEIMYMKELSLLYLGENLFSGSLPDVFGSLPDLSYLFLDSNLLTGTIPVSLGDAPYLQSVNMSSNHLTGTIPISLSQLTELVVLLLQDNALSGNIYNVFNIHVQVNLTTVQLSDNQLTGTLPDAIGELAGLQVFAAVSNCFTGSLPESLCDSSSLVTLALDGMQSARVCQQRLFPAALEGSIVAQSLYSIRNPFTGGIPECLFRMSNLTTLHLSGNGLTGSLSSNISISSSLLDLSLSHNKLEGRIPSAVLQRQWSTLDLSYNRFTGTLEDNTLSQYPSSTSMYLDNNRLSGGVPGGFLHLATVDVLQSNLFSCRNDRSNLPQHDPNLDKYECGSVVLDSTLYTWIAVVMCVALLLVTALYWQSARCKQWGMVTWQQVQCWWTTVDAEVHHLQQLFSLLGVVVQTAVVCAIYILLVLLPVYAVCSALRGTYTYQYAWSLSAAYLSGEASFAAEAVFLLGLVLFAIICFKVLLSGTPSEVKAGDVDVEVETINTTTYHWYVLFFVVTVLNFTVVLGVNIAYVIIALSQSGKALTATQTALAVFKVAFNSGCSPMLLRWASQRFLGAQVSASGFVSVQLIVSIVNNIFIPCLVVAIISPSCFYNIFESVDDVTSSYTYQGKCIDVDPFSRNTITCLKEAGVTAKTSYSPPFTYSYQCSSSFVTYYAPAFVIMCILAGFGIPLGQVVLQRLHSRAVVGTRWFGLLDLVLPRVLKPVHENPTRNEYMFFNNAGQQLVTILTYLGLLLTFGAVFPPLALCLAVTMLSITVFARLKVGRLLVQAREQGQAEEYVRILEQECADVSRGNNGAALVTRAVRGICCFACGFYTLFLFDTLGDAQGLSGAYWVLIVCPTVFPVALGLRKWRWNRWVLSVNSIAEQSRADTVQEGTELAPVTSTKSPMHGANDLT